MVSLSERLDAAFIGLASVRSIVPALTRVFWSDQPMSARLGSQTELPFHGQGISHLSLGTPAGKVASSILNVPSGFGIIVIPGGGTPSSKLRFCTSSP